MCNKTEVVLKEEQRAVKRALQNRLAQKLFRQRKEQHLHDLEVQVQVLTRQIQDRDEQLQKVTEMQQFLQMENNSLKSMLANSVDKELQPKGISDLILIAPIPEVALCEAREWGEYLKTASETIDPALFGEIASSESCDLAPPQKPLPIESSIIPSLYTTDYLSESPAQCKERGSSFLLITENSSGMAVANDA